MPCYLAISIGMMVISTALRRETSQSVGAERKAYRVGCQARIDVFFS